MNGKRSYVCIDLKSFYASVECVDRGLNPLTANLVVADASRTEKTICLAVSPSLKSFGIPGRARLFEVVQRVKEVNRERKNAIAGKAFRGKSHELPELEKNPFLELTYVVAPPRMAKYMQISTQIYEIYLKYVSAEDIHAYSVDEVFMDVTSYLKMYKKTAHELAVTMIRDVLESTGITATAGIGTNMFLAKVAMDIVAKHIPADADGVRIAELDEASFRRRLWAHTPLTDFWRVGRAYERRLNALGLYTMGDIARCSLGKPDEYYNEDLLYKEFGINAELLIDHAWGEEPALISDIKAYRPSAKSMSVGQVLEYGYDNDHARVVVKEMASSLVLDMVKKGYVTNLVDLTVGYDVDNLNFETSAYKYTGEITVDRYGRKVPKGAHASFNLGEYTASTRKIVAAVVDLFNRLTDKNLHIRRMYVAVNTVDKDKATAAKEVEQLSFFDDEKREDVVEQKDGKVSQSVLKIQQKYGKNAILMGNSFTAGATQRKRNKQIGGHKA